MIWYVVSVLNPPVGVVSDLILFPPRVVISRLVLTLDGRPEP